MSSAVRFVRVRRIRRIGLGALAVCALALAIVPERPANAQSASKKQELLEKFAPVMALRRQAEHCGKGERYRPISVDHVLGRDDVVLRDADGNVVTRGPTAGDLAGLGEDYWLDFPYDALKPGCNYEKWGRSLDADPSIYGRVTRQDGRLVLQYWFYWVYNQWNDLHESDWEMIQLQFDTDKVGDALRSKPARYAYAQHEGAEYADRGDAKVQMVDGTHPVVYSSGGSHASYYSSTQWFGKSGATGFGCDDTTGPTDRITPQVVVLPANAPTSGKFAWLSYRGHWGQEERFFNNGPTGPAVKGRWDDPLGWVEENGRTSSIALPFASSGATRTFCSLSATGSSIFNRVMDDPLEVAVISVAVLVALVMMVRFGSRGLLGAAARAWWRQRRALLVIGAATFAGGVLTWVVQYIVLSLTRIGTLVDVAGGNSPWILPLVAIAGAIVAVPVLAWVVAATILLHAGESSATRALTRVARERPLLGAAIVVVAVIGLTLFLTPLFVLLMAVWLVAPLMAVREAQTGRRSLRASRRRLRGHRWRSLALAVTLCLVLAIGGLLGALVLLATSVGFTGAAFVVAAANAFLVPYVALVVVRYYEAVVGERAQLEAGVRTADVCATTDARAGPSGVTDDERER